MRSAFSPKAWVHFLFPLLMFGAGGVSGAAEFGEVEKILGVPGQMQEGAFILRFPRNDIQMRIQGAPVPTALGFGSWTAWKEVGAKVMVMGDLVLLEREINPVISALDEAGIQVTALHNHFVAEEPRVMYMHVHGMGQAAALARGVRSALDQTSTPQPQPAGPGTSQPALSLDTKRIEQIVGHAGQAGGGVFKITVGRPGVKVGGVEMTSSMGLNHWAAFVGTDERARVAGDIAMTAKEVNDVVRALSQGGMDVVAVHNHMLEEEPRIFFLHYWGSGPAAELAEKVRAAFDRVKGPVR
jgi:hypothetical protein